MSTKSSRRKFSMWWIESYVVEGERGWTLVRQSTVYNRPAFTSLFYRSYAAAKLEGETRRFPGVPFCQEKRL